MSISSQYTREKQRAQERSTAIKILDLMKPLRMSNSPNKARRWVWELLQNAKDVCNNKVKVKIDFNEQEKVLRFYHNGKPFNVQSIAFLIEQVSTKERDSEKTETTGKFGTGFLTTHLLSEVVELDSIIEDEEKNLRNFSITLDRSGRTVDEILASIEKSAEKLKEVDDKSIINNYDPNAYNTCFTYRLTDAGIAVAKQGLSDLMICLPYTMMFLDKIESVYLSHSDVLFTIRKEAFDKTISFFHFMAKNKETIEKSTFIYSKNDRVEIAFPLNKEINALEKINEKCPRLFCDFPLVGTENFPFPAIVQSKYFDPTEPRDAIFLSYANEREVSQNTKLISEAIEILDNMAKFFSKAKFEKLCYLFDINRSYKNENVDSSWLDKELIEKLNQILLYTEIVKNANNEYVSVLCPMDDSVNIYFPQHAKKELRAEMWKLVYQIDSTCIPEQNDYDEWHDFLWKACPKLNIDKLFSFLKKNSTIDTLLSVFQDEEVIYGWLNSFINLIIKDSNAWDSIKNDECAVMLNQKGNLALYSKISRDKIENEILKGIIDECGYDIKNHLLHKRIILEENRLTGEINDAILIKKITDELCSSQFNNKRNVAQKIIALYCEANHEKINKLYGFYERLFHCLGPQQKINVEGDILWHETEKIVIDEIVSKITAAKRVETLKESHQFRDNNQTVSWIASFVEFLEKHYDTVDRKTIAILPNQNGILCSKEKLLLDDGSIDDELKNIAKLLGEDIREKLLDKSVFLKMPENFVVSEQEVSDIIRRKVEEALRTANRTNMPWNAFNKLLIWFNKNSKKAKMLFGTIYENKHRLYDDDTVAANIEKAEKLDELLNDYNINDISQIRNLLEKNKNDGTDIPKLNWTQEALTNLGITNEEEFEAFIQEKNGISQFDHQSKPTYEMFKFAHQLIARAKENVIKRLKELSDYDCDDMEELATTILGGIKKNGQEINIVVRPSDYGEVLIYYSAETDLLKYEVSELWIDNGTTTPRQLTLGEILKNTGIKRIPV